MQNLLKNSVNFIYNYSLNFLKFASFFILWSFSKHALGVFRIMESRLNFWYAWPNIFIYNLRVPLYIRFSELLESYNSSVISSMIKKTNKQISSGTRALEDLWYAEEITSLLMSSLYITSGKIEWFLGNQCILNSILHWSYVDFIFPYIQPTWMSNF